MNTVMVAAAAFQRWKAYTHEHRVCNPDFGLLHWLHTIKALILEAYHGLPVDNFQFHLDEFLPPLLRSHSPGAVDSRYRLLPCG